MNSIRNFSPTMTSAISLPPTLGQRLAERERPDRAAVMVQRWDRLAFLHWRFDPVTVQRTLPPGLTVDTFDGAAWVGYVPLFMRNVRLRFLPPIPYVSDFLEINLRTYVYDSLGRPGVYFYALACDQPLVVEVARRLLELNYEHAELKAEIGNDEGVSFQSRRVNGSTTDHFAYRALPPAGVEALPGSLEFFLIERYRLFAGDADRLITVRMHHAPYRIRGAECASWGEEEFRRGILPAPDRPPDHVCAAETVNLEVFLPEVVESADRQRGAAAIAWGRAGALMT